MTSRDTIVQGPHIGLEGKVEWCVLNSDGSVAEEGGHKNLILDNGLDMLGRITDPWGPTYLGNSFSYCAVGIGNSTPIISQLALDSEKARTANYLTSPLGSCGSFQPDYHTYTLKRTFDFPLGALNSAVDGPYAEVGFSPYSLAGNNLFSRSLFKDGGGSPITVSVSSSQQLRVTYSLTATFNMDTWVAGSVNITGIGLVGYKSRMQWIGGNPPGPNIISSTYFNHSLFSQVQSNGAATTTNPSLFSIPWMEPSVIRDYAAGMHGHWLAGLSSTYPDETTLPPVGGNLYCSIDSPDTGACSTGLTIPTYVNGTFYQDLTANWNLSTANFAIHWLVLAFRPNLGYLSVLQQACLVYHFDTPFTKDNLHTLSLTFRRTWGRI